MWARLFQRHRAQEDGICVVLILRPLPTEATEAVLVWSLRAILAGGSSVYDNSVPQARGSGHVAHPRTRQWEEL